MHSLSNQYSFISEARFLSIVNNTIIQQVKKQSTGKLQKMALYHMQTRGKMIRSKMIHGLGSLYDTNPSRLIQWATACELLHEASLVHDDFQDQDEIRRGQTAVWKKFGAPQAINLGDFLLMLSYRQLEKLPFRLLRLHTNTAIALTQGQVEDLKLARQSQLLTEEERYLNCIRDKTGSLFSAIATGVALLAGRHPQEIEEISFAFQDLGIIFQMQDDILDIFGNKKRGTYSSDIKGGKFNILLTLHLKLYPEDHELIHEIMQKNEETTELEDVEVLKKLFQSKETLNYAIKYINKHANTLLSQNRDSLYLQCLSHAIELILKPIQNI